MMRATAGRQYADFVLEPDLVPLCWRDFALTRLKCVALTDPLLAHQLFDETAS